MLLQCFLSAKEGGFQNCCNVFCLLPPVLAFSSLFQPPFYHLASATPCVASRFSGHLSLTPAGLQHAQPPESSLSRIRFHLTILSTTFSTVSSISSPHCGHSQTVFIMYSVMYNGILLSVLIMSTGFAGLLQFGHSILFHLSTGFMICHTIIVNITINIPIAMNAIIMQSPKSIFPYTSILCNHPHAGRFRLFFFSHCLNSSGVLNGPSVLVRCRVHVSYS
jgi:hypothetical protein